MTTPGGISRRSHEVDDAGVLARLLAAHAPLRDLRLQDLDLAPVADRLLEREDLQGLVVLGGSVPPRLLAHLRRHGAVVFPPAPQAPVDVYRARLYRPEELYAGIEQGYATTPDARAYAWALDTAHDGDVYPTLLRAIHDDSVTDALDEALAGRDAVGVMGGHVLRGPTRGMPTRRGSGAPWPPPVTSSSRAADRGPWRRPTSVPSALTPTRSPTLSPSWSPSRRSGPT